MAQQEREPTAAERFINAMPGFAAQKIRNDLSKPIENNLQFSTTLGDYSRGQISKTEDLTRNSYGTIDKVTGEPKVPDSTLYDNLINLILNAKKDVKFARSAETREGAARFGKARGLRLGEKGEDINHDGVEDVVLYNKAGYPVVINGYYLAPSKLPFRKAYLEANPSPIDRMKIGGYKGYMNSQWGAEPTFGMDGKRKVEYDAQHLPDSFSDLKDKGWRIPAAPRRELSIYQFCIKIIGEGYKDWEKNFKESVPKKAWVVKCVPKITLFSLIYADIIDRALIAANPSIVEDISKSKPQSNAEAWEIYKQIKKKNNSAIKKFLKERIDDIIPKLESPDNTGRLMENVLTNEFLASPNVPDIDREDMDEQDWKMCKYAMKQLFNEKFAELKEKIMLSAFGFDEKAYESPQSPVKKTQLTTGDSQ